MPEIDDDDDEVCEQIRLGLHTLSDGLTHEQSDWISKLESLAFCAAEVARTGEASAELRDQIVLDLAALGLLRDDHRLTTQPCGIIQGQLGRVFGGLPEPVYCTRYREEKARRRPTLTVVETDGFNPSGAGPEPIQPRE